MKRATALALMLVAAMAPAALAQEGLATGSTIHGSNTIQQAPSGGAVRGQAGLGAPDGTTQGQPTEEEKRIERENNAATQICKGC